MYTVEPLYNKYKDTPELNKPIHKLLSVPNASFVYLTTHEMRFILCLEGFCSSF